MQISRDAISRMAQLIGWLSSMGFSDSDTNDPGSAAWRLVEPYVEQVSIYDGPAKFLSGIATLPKAAQHLYAVWWCDSEICNGGLHQFFSNSTGVLAPEAVEGYRAVNLLECADLVLAAIDKFGPSFPRERVERKAALQSLKLPGKARKEWDPFYDLDVRYYAARDRAGYDNVIDTFARRNAR